MLTLSRKLDECKPLGGGGGGGGGNADGKVFAGKARVSLTFRQRVEVGRCRLPVSKPMLKAPMMSSLEAKIAFSSCFQCQLALLQRGVGAARAEVHVRAAECAQDAAGGPTRSRLHHLRRLRRRRRRCRCRHSRRCRRHRHSCHRRCRRRYRTRAAPITVRWN